MVSIEELMREMDVSDEEALAYVKYFDWKRSRGLRLSWEHYTVRLFVLSVAYIGNRYYSVVRKVKDEVVYKELEDLAGFEWLRGWIFQRDLYGQFWLIVSSDNEGWDEFKRAYKEIKAGVRTDG